MASRHNLMTRPVHTKSWMSTRQRSGHAHAARVAPGTVRLVIGNARPLRMLETTDLDTRTT
jgi:hypothetical protein